MTEIKNKLCLYCNKKLSGRQTKFCYIKCQRKFNYSLNKDKYFKSAYKWQKNNLERTREIKKKGLAKFMREKPDRFKELVKKANKKYNKTEKGKIARARAMRNFNDRRSTQN